MSFQHVFYFYVHLLGICSGVSQYAGAAVFHYSAEDQMACAGGYRVSCLADGRQRLGNQSLYYLQFDEFYYFLSGNQEYIPDQSAAGEAQKDVYAGGKQRI